MKFIIIRKKVDQIGYIFILIFFYSFHVDLATETIAQYDERYYYLQQLRIYPIQFKFNIRKFRSLLLK